MRNLKNAVSGFMAGHRACTECSVGGHHIQAGVVRSTVGGQIENSDMSPGVMEVDFGLTATPEIQSRK
jgi:hypothetical protein